MGLQRRSIRLRIFLLVLIPIFSLIGLYACAGSVTARDAIKRVRSRTVENTIGLPSGAVEAQIDAERLLAQVYLASPTPQNLAALRGQEARTDGARSAFRTAAAVTLSSPAPQQNEAISALLTNLASLSALRAART